MMPDHRVTPAERLEEEIHGEMNAATKVILKRSMLHFAISLQRFFVMMLIPLCYAFC